VLGLANEALAYPYPPSTSLSSIVEQSRAGTMAGTVGAGARQRFTSRLETGCSCRVRWVRSRGVPGQGSPATCAVQDVGEVVPSSLKAKELVKPLLRTGLCLPPSRAQAFTSQLSPASLHSRGTSEDRWLQRGGPPRLHGRAVCGAVVPAVPPSTPSALVQGRGGGGGRREPGAGAGGAAVPAGAAVCPATGHGGVRL